MIAFLEGILVEKQPTRAVLNVAGVGYEVLIPLSSYDRLPAPGQVCRLVTHLHVREDAHLLYGFMAEAERATFLLLMQATGVGPKIALSALSGMTVREIRAAIVQGDVKRLTSIPGVGRKVAERMVVDLRDRISRGEALEAVAGAPGEGEDSRLRDAVLALVALGYTQETARKMALEAMKKPGMAEASVEDVIRKALGG